MISNFTNNINIDYILGVDLSPKMLKLAGEKRINDNSVYSNLYAGPMTQFISALAKYRYTDMHLKIDTYDNNIVDVDNIVTNGFDKKFLNGNKQLLNENPILVVAADDFDLDGGGWRRDPWDPDNEA